MNQLTSPEVKIIDGRPMTTSLAVADCFGKQHKNVIQKIETLECSPEFIELNFQLNEYIDPIGRKLPSYQITKDGFVFLAMGFTGKKAAAFKEAYIQAFNDMEARLQAQRHEQLQANRPASQMPLSVPLKVSSVDYSGVSKLSIDARALHEYLGIKTSYCDWIRRRINGHSLLAGRDFQARQRVSQHRNGVRQQYHHITLDAARRIVRHVGGERSAAVMQFLQHNSEPSVQPELQLYQGDDVLEALARSFKGRVLISFNQGQVASAQFVPAQSAVVELENLANFLKDPALLPDKYIPQIMQTCVDRMCKQ